MALTSSTADRASEPLNRVKGHTFKSWFEAYEKVAGAAAKSALVDALAPDFSSAVRFGAIVSSGWYPIHWYTSLYDVHAKLRGRTPGFAKKMGHLTTEQDFRGVYAFIVRLASPATVFSNAQRLLKLYVQHCETRTIEKSDAHVRVWISIPGSTDEMWEEFTGGSEAVIEVNGAKNPSVSFSRLDASSVHVDGRWSAS